MKALVFDPRIWGGKDKGDNSHCWQEADVLALRGRGQDAVGDVRWPDGSITRGHFLSAMRPVPRKPADEETKP